MSECGQERGGEGKERGESPECNLSPSQGEKSGGGHSGRGRGGGTEGSEGRRSE